MQPLDRLLDRALHQDLTVSPDARLGGLPHAEKFSAKRRTSRQNEREPDLFVGVG